MYNMTRDVVEKLQHLLSVSFEQDSSTCSSNVWLLLHDSNLIIGDIVALMDFVTSNIS